MISKVEISFYYYYSFLISLGLQLDIFLCQLKYNFDLDSVYIGCDREMFEFLVSVIPLCLSNLNSNFGALE